MRKLFDRILLYVVVSAFCALAIYIFICIGCGECIPVTALIREIAEAV